MVLPPSYNGNLPIYGYHYDVTTETLKPKKEEKEGVKKEMSKQEKIKKLKNEMKNELSKRKSLLNDFHRNGHYKSILENHEGFSLDYTRFKKSFISFLKASHRIKKILKKIKFDIFDEYGATKYKRKNVTKSDFDLKTWNLIKTGLEFVKLQHEDYSLMKTMKKHEAMFPKTKTKKSRKCPRCETKNRKHSSFCSQCGHQFLPTEKDYYEYKDPAHPTMG